MYCITKERVVIDNEECTVYGIKCNKEYVPDVSADREEVEKLIERLNKYELLPCHLHDTVQDFIN